MYIPRVKNSSQHRMQMLTVSGTQELISGVYFKGIKDMYGMKRNHQRGKRDVIIPG